MGEQNEKKKPIQKFQAGVISSAVWENKGKKDNKEFFFNTIGLQRSYTDKDNKWQNENLSLRVSDIPKVILVLNKAYEYIIMKGKEEEKED